MVSKQQLDEERIFHTARGISNPEIRSDYLDQICVGDVALRERVEALLKVHEQEQDFLKSSAEPAPTADATDSQRMDHAMVYDAARQRAVLLGEQPAVPRISDLGRIYSSSLGKLELDLMSSHQMTERQVLDAILARSRAANVREIFLEVRPSNVTALALYRKKGFHSVARRPAYYQASEGREDAAVLAKKLTSNDR